MIGQSSPPSRLDTWLASLDGYALAGVIVLAFVVLCVLCMVPSVLGRLSRPEPTTATRPTTSNRKAGRVSGGQR